MSNQYPPLPEPTDMALVYGPGMTGTTYATLSKSYEPSCAMFNVAQLRAYADATVVLRSVPMTDAELAHIFHDEYERLAPSFGYATRSDTKQFDPESPNGKLMTAVCGVVARALEARKPADAPAQPPKAQEPPACGGCNNQFFDECGGSGVKGATP